MAINRAKKDEIYKKFSEIGKGEGSKIFVGFRGITVADATEMRSVFRKEEIGYVVAKKTLLKRALEAAKVEGIMPETPGEIAVAYGSDPLAPAREVYKFVKRFKDRLSILGGIFEGKFADAAFVTALAAIPPREALYGQFVNVINSPIQGLVMALDGIARKKEI